MSMPVPAVAELQGLYGAFSFAEKMLQKIWLRGDFDRAAARLSDGRSVRIRFPGRWNLLGGPDFKEARLAFGGAAEITGDVELHLHAQDWHAHGHAGDRAYDRVVLHVVLFPPEFNHVTRDAAGRAIPLLVLLPLLPHDLEEFAAAEAVESLAGQSLATAPEELVSLGSEKLSALLCAHALRRWEQKVHFAKLRLTRLGWEPACHHAALEILGYRFNRAPMLRVATRWPLAAWRAKTPVAPEEIFARESEAWSLQGVRPANHPLTRLRQYAAWTRSVPAWPDRVGPLFHEFSAMKPSSNIREVRRKGRFPTLRRRIAEEVCGQAIGGTRLDNFICDGLLPLYAARGPSFDFVAWFHWFPGDQPPSVLRMLRQMGVCDGGGRPVCHGFAQGLFDWFIERDARR